MRQRIAPVLVATTAFAPPWCARKGLRPVRAPKGAMDHTRMEGMKDDRQ